MSKKENQTSAPKAFELIGTLSSNLFGLFHLDGRTLHYNREKEPQFEECVRSVFLAAMSIGLPLDYVIQAAVADCNDHMTKLVDARNQYRLQFKFDRGTPTNCEAFPGEIRCFYRFEYCVVRIGDAFDLVWDPIEVSVSYPRSN
jgi:hypothetical protein